MSFLKRHSTGVILFTIVVLLGAIFAARHQKPPVTNDDTVSNTFVTLVNAKDFQKNTNLVTANGTVEASQQADLRSQAIGQVARVNVSVGSKVTRGQVLVSLVSSDLQAQLAQAQAGLKAQQAVLNQLYQGARSEDIKLGEAQLAAAEKALADTKKQQELIVANAFSAMMNSTPVALPKPGQASTATITLSGSYTGTTTGEYYITFPSGGDKPPFTLSGIENTTGWIAQRGIAQPLGSRGLFFTVSGSGTIYPGDTWVVTLPNTQAASYLPSYNAYQTALQTQQTAVNGAQSGVDTAKRALELKKSSATDSQIQAQRAAIDQAAASVQLMNAQIAKTIITSPIDGVVSEVPIKYGELLTPGALVARVVNKSGMQVKVFVSQDDLPKVAIKDPAIIGEAVFGTVTNIAPSVDQQTKTAEVGVAVLNPDTSGLTIGQNVSVRINAETSSSTQSAVFVLPIQTVKIKPDGTAAVYTVDANGLVVEHAVTLGKVDGEMVQVTAGISPDMQLVSAVYQLSPGQKVTVQ